MDKDSLLASLTGDQLYGSAKPDTPEQDLFGDIAIDDGQVRVPTVHAEAPLVTPVATHPAPSAARESSPVDSLLCKSGLLGIGVTADESGGLFDEVDEDEQKAAQDAMTSEQRMQKEMEARQLEEGQLRMQHQQQQQQLQQKQQQQQSIHQPYAKQEPVPVNAGNSASMYEQQSAMMQSAVMPQLLLSEQVNAMTLNNGTDSGFYREHSAPIPQNTTGVGMGSPNGYVGPSQQNTGSYYYGTREQQIQHPAVQHQQQHHQQQQHQQQQQQYSGNFVQPSATAGMHNATQNMNLGRIRKITLVKPQDVAPLYVDIRVTEPMLIQTQSFLLSSTPYWSYQITSQLAGNQGTWLVRRRFRHVVALEDRLRQACPGSIIPPRPEKHATRALEEASTQQSAEFAVQRSKELEQYLNQVARHPVAGQSQVLRLFLGLQDDIGTAWPEVSTNALTRLQAVGVGVTMKVAESTNLTTASAPVQEWEEDAELLGLCSSENVRLGAVSQAVPKLEGTVILLREQGDAAGFLGMELSKASKTLDLDYKFFDLLSSGLLRNGRRTKRLAVEMSAAMESFLLQYKLVRYEKMAMQDRRQAIQRKAKERGRADARAVHLSQQQRHLQVNGQMHHLSQLEQNAITMDNQALDAVTEANEIGNRLKLEINRVAIDRRIAWNNSIKTIANSMKEACSERLAIWESTLEAFENLTKNEG